MSPLRKLRRIAAAVTLGAALLVLLALLAITGLLRGSLPKLRGTQHLAGLRAPARIERDARGLPTLTGSDWTDLARAIGYLHAQERFFQMDLLRRSAAGELAELVGPAALDFDRNRRRHRMRHVAHQVVAQLGPEDRRLLDAYAAGVNAGLAALLVRPPEYLLLRQSPASWQPADSILVVHAMAFDLQEADGDTERALGRALQALGPSAFAFYCPTGTEWEAPLDESRTPVSPMPTPEEFSAADRGHADLGPEPFEPGLLPGSNAWAVGGRRTATGAALVADDMHLGHGLPNVWFWVSLVWPNPTQPRSLHRVTGVTLPGAPIVVAGSNGRIAWGFTNATTDNSDIVDLELSPEDPGLYRSPEGWQRFVRHSEVLRIAGRASETTEILWTCWGPVVQGDPGRPRQAVRWTFHSPSAVNLVAARFAAATNALQALHMAKEAGIPAQNFVVGDAQGHIGWTLTGRIPNRVGLEGRLPGSWADGTRRWDGWIHPDAKPQVYDPPEGLIWSANQRMHGSEAYRRAGDGDFDLGARAGQIRDRLRALNGPASPADMLAIQLDHEARFLARWQTRMLQTVETLRSTDPSPRLGETARLLADWGKAASTNSAGYLLVRTFRSRVLQRLLEPADQACRNATGAPAPRTQHFEGSAWALLERQPAHLLSPRYAGYGDLLADALRATLEQLDTTNAPLAQQTWGRRNRVEIRHPLSRAVPQLARILDLPPEALPGDDHMPRAQGPSFGASERFGVSPGHEQQGYFHMPGGPSGHFLSLFYTAGHRAWAEGRPLPFLPGPPAHELRLVP